MVSPSAAAMATGRLVKPARVEPRQAPLTKSGVTSPPRKPAMRQRAVSANFQAKASAAVAWRRALSMRPRLSPVASRWLAARAAKASERTTMEA